MDRFIRFDKDDFIGKQATLKQAERGLAEPVYDPGNDKLRAK
jgi:glycine cleavage system aminomethyltransferase T